MSSKCRYSLEAARGARGGREGGLVELPFVCFSSVPWTTEDSFDIVARWRWKLKLVRGVERVSRRGRAEGRKQSGGKEKKEERKASRHRPITFSRRYLSSGRLLAPHNFFRTFPDSSSTQGNHLGPTRATRKPRSDLPSPPTHCASSLRLPLCRRGMIPSRHHPFSPVSRSSFRPPSAFRSFASVVSEERSFKSPLLGWSC